jgi:predicted RNase H-like HicB family nuclease
MNKYEVIIYWSDEDKVFIAEVPELKGCIAHGDTPEQALKEVTVVADEWMKIAEENGWEIPVPKGRLMYA